jgi:hypothetical protein
MISGAEISAAAFTLISGAGIELLRQRRCRTETQTPQQKDAISLSLRLRPAERRPHHNPGCPNSDVEVSWKREGGASGFWTWTCEACGYTETVMD